MNGDLISREDALNALKGVIARTGAYGVSVEVILANIPAVEAEPVVHAHWEFLNDYQSRCSRCHSEVFVDHNDEPPYCERCGAHMDEEVAE